VIVENPTWPGALEAFALRGANLVPVPVDRDGMLVDRLEQLLVQYSPKLIYSVPTFHNPTGAVLSAERRKQLIALARRYGVPILEDDALREVRFGSPLPRPLAALDTSGNVINVGSFTKALLPAARIGYLVGPAALRESVVSRKRWADMYCSPLMQIALSEYLASGQAVRFWKRCNRIYGQRQRAMLDALQHHLPAGAHWHRVGGGPQMWVQVPNGISVGRLFQHAVEAGVPFAPGEAFYAEPDDQSYLRLNFAVVNEAQIERGVAVLGELMRSELNRATLVDADRNGRLRQVS
jgi:DNA-binding transcriptional MocR family regulator